MAQFLDCIRSGRDELVNELTSRVIPWVTRLHGAADGREVPVCKSHRGSLFENTASTGMWIEKMHTLVGKLEQCTDRFLHGLVPKLDNYICAIARKPDLGYAVFELNS